MEGIFLVVFYLNFAPPSHAEGIRMTAHLGPDILLDDVDVGSHLEDPVTHKIVIAVILPEKIARKIVQRGRLPVVGHPAVQI